MLVSKLTKNLFRIRIYNGGSLSIMLRRDHRRKPYLKSANWWKYPGLFSVILLVVCLNALLTGCSDSALNNATNHTESGRNTPVKSDAPSPTEVSKGTIAISSLPVEARKTMLLIESGGPFPYAKDGAVFNNFEGLLPGKPSGYYHEYTVVTPGAIDRGARRIVAGANGEYYYTDDHYSTFRLIVE